MSISSSLLTRVKRVTAAFLLLAAAGPAHVLAQTSPFAQVAVAGSFNGWDTDTPNMTLIADNLWQADLLIQPASFQFKFSTPGFSPAWGVFNQPHQILPQSMTADPNGGDINVTAKTTNSLIRFLFHDTTREYTVFLLDNFETNLLYNTSFEIANPNAERARYWEFGRPNAHGGFAGTAQRRGTPWGIVPRTGNWVGLIAGSWAGGTSGTWWQQAPVEPGITYEAAGWFQPESNNLWSATSQELKLEYYNFDQSTLLASYTTDLSSIPPNDTVWARQFVSGIAPPGAYWGRLVVQVNGAGPSGTFRIDDVSLVATAPKRVQDFNDWDGTILDATYSRAGWILSTGRTVSAYTFGGQSIPLARSGLAASLSNPTASPNGSFIRSPRFADGIGAITFHYRHGHQGNPAENPEQPVSFKVQRSTLGDFWTTIAEVSNIFDISYRRFDIFENIATPQFIRIVHTGGSTNRLLIDDIEVSPPTSEPRLMTFNTWTGATTPGDYSHFGWQIRTGRVTAALAIDGLAGQILGANNSTNFLRSPNFTNGYGTITFQYRPAANTTRTLGFALEASSNNGATWTELDRVTNITALGWQTYNRFFFQVTPHTLRIRNLAETNINPQIAVSFSEGFDTFPASPPPGWTFENIVATYNSAASSGLAIPSLRLDVTGARLITPALINPTNLSFMTLGQSINSNSTLTIEGVVDGTWQTLTVLTNITNSKTNRNLVLSPNVSQIRFTFEKVATGNLAIDDVAVNGIPLGSPLPPANLALENISIGNPVETRLQTFDAWPVPAPAFHQGWTVDGIFSVGPARALSGQALALAFQGAGDGFTGDYYTGVENASKTSYATAIIDLDGVDWTLTEALIGTLDADFKVGSRSIRARGQNGAMITMNRNKLDGIGTLSFQYRRYGTDGAQQPWAVEYTQDNGVTWLPIGDPIVATADVQTFSTNLNVSGAIRVRIRLTTTPGASGNRRINFDEINITSFGAVSDAAVASSITTHLLPQGIGPITFDYRHFNTTPPAPADVMQAAIQTSTNGITWNTQGQLTISNTTYQTYELFLNLTNQFYARVIVTNGQGEAVFDNIHVRRPQPPANVILTGYYEPAIPFTNDTVTLFANAQAQFGASDITVTSFYRIGNAGPFTAIGMELVGGSTYQATSSIPAQPAGTIVEYYVQAWFNGPGANLNRPVRWPDTAPATNAFYGIPRQGTGLVWINEVDYVAEIIDPEDPFGFPEEAEFIELAGYAGADIQGWRVDLVKGTTTGLQVFASYTLTNQTMILNENNGYGFYVLAQPGIPTPPRRHLLDGPGMFINIPFGIILYNEVGGIEDTVALNGFTQGFDFVEPIDSDFPDPFEPGMSNSVSLTGTGFVRSDFDWIEAVGTHTPGTINQGQTFADAPLIGLATSSLTFNYLPGSLNPNPQQIVVSNAGGSALSYNLTPNVGWLSVDPASHTLAPGATQVHTVFVDTAGITGNRNGAISIAGNAPNSPQSVAVSLIQSTLPAALVHYTLDDGVSTNAANSGSLGINARGGLVNATWSLEAQGVSERLGDFAYIATSTASRIQTGAAVTGLNQRAQITLTGWLKPTGAPGVHRILGNRASNQGFDLFTTPDHQSLSFISSTGTAPAAITATNLSLPSGEWTFFAIAFDAADATPQAVRFYRGSPANGIVLQSAHPRGALAATGASTNRLFTGGSFTNNAFPGWIDDIRIYGSALDPMSIEAIRVAGATRLTGIGTPPVIVNEPEDYLVANLTPVTLSVFAAGEPLPLYQWRKFGQPIPGATASSLNLGNVTTNQAGGYDVVVYNAYGSVTSSVATVMVDGIMTFIVQPQNQTVIQTQTALFTAEAVSTNQTITYQWRRNNVNLSGQTNNTLLLENVQLAQAGNYTVVASDGTRSLTSTVAVLTVQTADVEFYFANGGILRPTSGVGVLLRWESDPNRVYDIWWTTNLKSGTHAFVRIATNLPGFIGFTEYTDTLFSVGPRGFYAIEAKPAP